MADAIPYNPFPVFLMFYLKKYVDVRNHPDPFMHFKRDCHYSNGNHGHTILDYKKMYERIHHNQGRR